MSSLRVIMSFSTALTRVPSGIPFLPVNRSILCCRISNLPLRNSPKYTSISENNSKYQYDGSYSILQYPYTVGSPIPHAGQRNTKIYSIKLYEKNVGCRIRLNTNKKHQYSAFPRTVLPQIITNMTYKTLRSKILLFLYKRKKNKVLSFDFFFFNI